MERNSESSEMGGERGEKEGKGNVKRYGEGEIGKRRERKGGDEERRKKKGVKEAEAENKYRKESGELISVESAVEVGNIFISGYSLA